MKRCLLLLLSFACCANLAVAEIIVNAEGKIQKYPDGSTLNVTAAKNIYIQYNTIKIFIPKGEEISLRCSGKDENYAIFVSGDSFKNIKSGSYTFSTSKPVSFTIDSDTSVLSIEKGNLEITDKKGNVAILTEGNTYKIDMSYISRQDGFIPLSLEKEEPYEQASQDVILSPSAAMFAKKTLTFTFLEDISYDDNIYLLNADKKGSAISSTQLFVKYLNNLSNSNLNFGAKANVGYNAYSEDSVKNDYMNAGAGISLNNSNFTLNEDFLYTSDPANSELTERVKRINNTASFRYRTSSIEKIFSIGFVVSDIFDNYQESDYKNLNRNRINAGAQIYYNLSQQTSFYLGYSFYAINYEKNKNNNSIGNSGIAGVNGNISATLNGTVQVSYDTRDYDNSIVGVTGYSNLVGYLVSLNYEPTSKNSILLSGERKMEETTFENNRYYVSSTVGITFKQKIRQKWTTSILVAYENMEYPETYTDIYRMDNLFKVKPSIDYKFKEHLFAGVWYQFRNKTSNYEVVKYDNNKVGAQIKLYF